MHILVVEDEQRMRELLRQGLTEDGHAVTVANDGHEGLSLAQGSAFDLIVLDVMLPGPDGFAIARQLRPQRDARHRGGIEPWSGRLPDQTLLIRGAARPRAGGGPPWSHPSGRVAAGGGSHHEPRNARSPSRGSPD